MELLLLAAPPPVGCPGVTPFAFALFWPVSFAACLFPPVPPSSHVRSIHALLCRTASPIALISILYIMCKKHLQQTSPPSSCFSGYNLCVPVLGPIALD